VFRRINKQLPQMTTLDMNYCSPKLLAACNLDLAVPGTYEPGRPVVCIKGFSPTLNVFATKQRPRKIAIFGSDGAEYTFLLKGTISSPCV
jgi:FKBP12-rapamycin complex-associated protein